MKPTKGDIFFARLFFVVGFILVLSGTGFLVAVPFLKELREASGTFGLWLGVTFWVAFAVSTAFYDWKAALLLLLVAVGMGVGIKIFPLFDPSVSLWLMQALGAIPAVILSMVRLWRLKMDWMECEKELMIP